MGSDDPVAGGNSGIDQSPRARPTFTDDRERQYAAISEEISAGAQIGGGYRRRSPSRQITPTIIGAAALLSVSVVLIGFAAYPFIFSAVLGEPFQYTNLPLPLCAPDHAYLHDDDCEKPPAGYKFHPGEQVPMLVGRCFHDPFNTVHETAYTLHRRLVSDQNGVQIAIGDTFSTAKEGCSVQRVVQHAIPIETPTGAYHFEGFAEVHVSWKTPNVLWRSVSFNVEGGG